MNAEQTTAPTVTEVVLQALRAANLPVSSLTVAQVADALLGAGCRIAGVQRAVEETPSTTSTVTECLMCSGSGHVPPLTPDQIAEQTELTRQILAEGEEVERLRTATRQVSELASEWDRFGLRGPAQRLRNILGEVTS